MLDYLTGKAEKSPRKEFVYVNDDGDIVAVRWNDWKVVYKENRGEAFGVWREPFTDLRVPLIFNLRRDPVRAGAAQREHLRRLAARPRLHHLAGANAGGRCSCLRPGSQRDDWLALSPGAATARQRPHCLVRRACARGPAQQHQAVDRSVLVGKW